MKEIIEVLLIGIRYASGSGHLNGCHNDVINIYEYLNNLYKDSNYELKYTILADTESKICGENPCIWPSRNNILDNLKKLRNSESKLFIMHYSGHGSSQTDWDGDEDDLKDEVMCPYDYSSAGCIKDDILNSEFLQHLKSDCFVRILMDCCRSGTIWDLKYKYGNNIIDTNSGAPNIACNVIVLSGCKDNQYSYDVYTAGESQGAFSYCFLKTMNQNSNKNSLTVENMIKQINNNLISGGWSGQTSTLTSSYKIKTNCQFFNFKIINGEEIASININEVNTTQQGIETSFFSEIFSICTIS